MTYILFNPLANKGHGSDGINKVAAAHAAEKPEIVDLSSIDAKSFLMNLSKDDRVVLCGGDGTIHKLVNNLDGIVPEVPIRLWRFGTGNDFLNDIAKDSDSREFLLNPYIQNLPRAELKDFSLRFLNGCSCGIDAMVCHKMNEYRYVHKKEAGYVTTAINVIFHDFQPMSGRVTVDGETIEYKKIWMAAAMNGRYQGGGMLFAPEQRRDSDLLCSLVWHDTGKLATLLTLPTVFWGGHVKRTKICDVRFGHEIRVELDEPTAIQTDGETVAGVNGYTARK